MPNIAEWIAELIEERRTCEERIKPHQQRIEAIDTAIADLQRLAEQVTGSSSPALTVSTGLDRPAVLRQPVPPVEHLPVWRWAFNVFTEVGRPLRVPELREEIRRRGGPDVPRESLRTIIRGKEDVFEALGDGFYGLREWPESKKRGNTTAG